MRSRAKLELTTFEVRLTCGVVVLLLLKFIVSIFNRADGSFLPDPASGRIYEIIIRSRGGVRWSLWVDQFGWVLYQLFSWPLYVLLALLIVSVSFHRYRTAWRSKNEGQRAEVED